MALLMWSANASAEAGFQSVGVVRLEAHGSAHPMLAFLESRIVPSPRRIREELTIEAHPAEHAVGQPVEHAAKHASSDYAEYVILRALRHGDSAFARCWKHAQRSQFTLPAKKARLVLEVDSDGVVRSARTDTDDADDGEVPACVATVGRRLPFPPIGRPTTLNLLLLF
jgi:hypothetical protein